MPNRRTFFAVTATSLLVWVRPTLAQSVDGRASAFVKNVGDRLVAVLNGPEGEKRAKLTAIIDGAVDVDGVAQFSLGRFWRNATPEQQQRFTQVFHQVLVKNVSAKLGDYRGVRFTMGRTQQRENNTVVSTIVERPNNPPANVDWIVSNTSDPKIIDLNSEGTSLRMTQRQDYASYLSHNSNNIDALINEMRR